MEKDLKDILFKDLCSRLPYGVKVESVFINLDTKEHKSCGIEVFDATSILMIRDGLGEFKPYLFPLSSMTGKHRAELFNLRINIDEPLQDSLCEIDFYHRNHFDYRDLIGKGLAIDATGLNIY